jgi:hypothetical protein
MSNLLDRLNDIADKLKELETHYAAANNKEPLSDEEVKLLEVLNATINSLDDTDTKDAAINNDQSTETQDKNGNSK